MRLWLLAAGCVALGGCRTETGEEDSSSWFNFGSRRGGGPGDDAPASAKTDAAKPGTDPVSAAWNEPTAGMKPGSSTEARGAPAGETRDKPKGAGGSTSPRPPQADAVPGAGATADALPLPALPAKPPGDHPSRPGPGLDLPATDDSRGRPADRLGLDTEGRGRDARAGAHPTLGAPEPTHGRGREGNGLPLPPPPADAGRPATGTSLGLPEIADGDRPRRPVEALRLPTFDDPTKNPAPAPATGGRDLDGTNHQGRAGESLDLPGLPAGASRVGPATSVPIDWDGLLTEPKVGGTRISPDAPDITGGARPRNGASPANRIPTDSGSPLPGRGLKPAIPGLRVETMPGATKSPAAPGLAVVDGGTDDTPGTKAPRRLDPADRITQPRPPASPRPLPPVGPESVSPPEPRIPLPFRLSEWISDEQQHRLWREQHLERAAQAPAERQTEQDRLRGALLKWLLRDPDAK